MIKKLSESNYMSYELILRQINKLPDNSEIERILRSEDIEEIEELNRKFRTITKFTESYINDIKGN